MPGKELLRLFPAAALLLIASAASAQTVTPKLDGYALEGSLPVDLFLSANLPAFPQDILDAVRSGVLDLRVRERYAATTGILNSEIFTAPASTPLPPDPTPPAFTPQTLLFLTVKVDSAQLSDKPGPNALLLGKVIYTVGPMAGPGLLDTVHITTFGYQEGSPAKFLLWGNTVPGSLEAHAAMVPGTLNIIKPPPPPPPPTNRAPVAVITPATQTVALPFLMLDGTKSYDPDGDPITFFWQPVGQPVTILAPTSPTPQVQFPGKGYYTVQLTVTDDHGLTGTVTSTILYVGR